MSQPTKLKLYHYWRSSSSWRVRWALAFKDVDCEYIPVNLLTGESESPEHLKRNPLGYVPALEIGGKLLTESSAIVEWIEETYPSPSYLPESAYDRGFVRQLSQIVNADIQPIQNLSVLDYFSEDAEKRKTWAKHWIHRGFEAYQVWAKQTSGKFSFGDQLGMADFFLIPQCYNAERFGIKLDDYPLIKKIYENAIKEPSCQASHPDKFHE